MLTSSLTTSSRVSNSFLFLENGLTSSMYYFSSDYLSLYPPTHFLRMCLNTIIAITNNNGESACFLRMFHISVNWWSFTRVSSGLKDSSQYSGRSQQCSRLDDLDSFCAFKLFYQAFEDRSKHTNDNCYYLYSHVLQLFWVLWPGQNNCLFFRLFIYLIFTQWYPGTANPLRQVFFFFFC